MRDLWWEYIESLEKRKWTAFLTWRTLRAEVHVEPKFQERSVVVDMGSLSRLKHLAPKDGVLSGVFLNNVQCLGVMEREGLTLFRPVTRVTYLEDYEVWVSEEGREETYLEEFVEPVLPWRDVVAYYSDVLHITPTDQASYLYSQDIPNVRRKRR